MMYNEQSARRIIHLENFKVSPKLGLGILLGICLVVTVVGIHNSGKKAKKAVVAEPAVTSAQSIEVRDLSLAKVILKPKRERMSIVKDPFQPLHYKGYAAPLRHQLMDSSQVMGYQFLGVIKTDDEYVAFLKSATQKGSFRAGDLIEGYTVREVHPEKVILSNGAQTITLKRGTNSEK